MSIVWDGTDLSTYGFTLMGEGSEESGLLSLPGMRRQVTDMPGRAWPEVVDLGRDPRDIRLSCALIATTHATLLSYRASFLALVSGSDFVALTVPDITARRLMVHTDGEIAMPRPELAWDTLYLRFVWNLKSLHSFWEDGSLVAVTPVGAEITNDGHEPCPVTWTCTVTAALPTGLWFEVGGVRFTYSGALATNDVLVVSTDLPAVALNAVADMANTLTTAEFPWLAVGANAITKSSSGFTLGADYRRWYR